MQQYVTISTNTCRHSTDFFLQYIKTKLVFHIMGASCSTMQSQDAWQKCIKYGNSEKFCEHLWPKKPHSTTQYGTVRYDGKTHGHGRSAWIARMKEAG